MLFKKEVVVVADEQEDVVLMESTESTAAAENHAVCSDRVTSREVHEILDSNDDEDGLPVFEFSRPNHPQVSQDTIEDESIVIQPEAHQDVRVKSEIVTTCAASVCNVMEMDYCNVGIAPAVEPNESAQSNAKTSTAAEHDMRSELASQEHTETAPGEEHDEVTQFWSEVPKQANDEQVKAITGQWLQQEEKLSQSEVEGHTTLLLFLEQHTSSTLRDVRQMSLCELQLATAFLRKALTVVDRASQNSMLKFVFDSLEISLSVLLLICRVRLATVSSQCESEAGVCQELAQTLGRVLAACFHETPGLSQQVFKAGKAIVEQAGLR